MMTYGGWGDIYKTATTQCAAMSGDFRSTPCSYTTQNLSNGELIVAITVYVPASYVFTGYGPWTLVKQVVHETKTRIVHEPCPKGQTLDPKIHKCVDISYCPPPKGYHTDSITHNCVPDNCQPGQVYNPITGKCEAQKPKCERPDADAKTDLDKDLKTMDGDLGDANEHGKTPPIPSCNSPNYNGTCLPTKNMTVAASGGKGTGPSCGINCTTGLTTSRL